VSHYGEVDLTGGGREAGISPVAQGNPEASHWDFSMHRNINLGGGKNSLHVDII